MARDSELEGRRCTGGDEPRPYGIGRFDPMASNAALSQVCAKDRFLELINDFVVFDAGIKKLCRHTQYSRERQREVAP